MIRRGPGGGIASILNGADGCLLPMTYLVTGSLLAVPIACTLFVWTIRDGLARAFNPAFTQWVIVGAGVILVLAIIWIPLASILTARALARRPATPVVPPVPAVNVKVAGGMLASEPAAERPRAALGTPQSLPPGAIPISVVDAWNPEERG
jgi:hypothetical protein